MGVAEDLDKSCW